MRKVWIALFVGVLILNIVSQVATTILIITTGETLPSLFSKALNLFLLIVG